MNFIIEKDDFLKTLKIVEKASIQKSIQPVLSNILIEAENNQVRFCATDLDLAIDTTAIAQVKTAGKITLPAKTLVEIASKIPNKPVEFNQNPENQMIKLSCGNAQFDVYGISADEFPVMEFDKENMDEYNKISIETKPFINSIKKTSFAAANFEAKNIISGVYCSISGNTLEMAATDGNRLAQSISTVESRVDEDAAAIIPAKALLEVQRIAGLTDSESLDIFINKSKVVFKIGEVYLFTRLLEGQYPPYRQLIPANCSKELIAPREEIINSLERVAIMVSEKMNIVKLRMADDKLYLTAETASEGMSEDVLDVKYVDEEMTIAFNYRFITDCLKVMDSENVKIGLNGSLSASVFRPDSEDKYLCLIMPIQIK